MLAIIVTRQNWFISLNLRFYRSWRRVIRRWRHECARSDIVPICQKRLLRRSIIFVLGLFIYKNSAWQGHGHKILRDKWWRSDFRKPSQAATPMTRPKTVHPSTPPPPKQLQHWLHTHSPRFDDEQFGPTRLIIFNWQLPLFRPLHSKLWLKPLGFEHQTETSVFHRKYRVVLRQFIRIPCLLT